jgi:hypothetical protein
VGIVILKEPKTLTGSGQKARSWLLLRTQGARGQTQLPVCEAGVNSFVSLQPNMINPTFRLRVEAGASARNADGVSAGDKLQLKANGKSADGRKLANGELVTVKEIRPDGRIALTDGRTLENNFRQFVRGYAITSYASQGKSVMSI